MSNFDHRHFFGLGAVLVIAGAVIPFLMVSGVLSRTNLFLSLFSFTISLAGLFLGVIGSAWYVRKHPPAINDEDKD